MTIDRPDRETIMHNGRLLFKDILSMVEEDKPPLEQDLARAWVGIVAGLANEPVREARKKAAARVKRFLSDHGVERARVMKRVMSHEWEAAGAYEIGVFLDGASEPLRCVYDPAGVIGKDEPQ